MVYDYSYEVRYLIDDGVYDVPPPCQESITDSSLFQGTHSVTKPATPGFSILEVDLLSSLGANGETDALCAIPKHKPSAAELFPRTNHQDKEECWDESGFLGHEADERLLEELGEELANMRDGSQE
ncbi:hypothetical protein MMC11_007392 [Xylographa trunciseda]|nr:hypothetical protein [Xylographa trunciseda]